MALVTDARPRPIGAARALEITMPTIAKIARAVLMLILIAAICWMLDWAVGYIGMPDPFNKVARGVVIIGGVFCAIAVLLDLVDIIKLPPCKPG
jgi:hypothetical protein